jgi:hypothetical protein
MAKNPDLTLFDKPSSPFWLPDNTEWGSEEHRKIVLLLCSIAEYARPYTLSARRRGVDLCRRYAEGEFGDRRSFARDIGAIREEARAEEQEAQIRYREETAALLLGRVMSIATLQMPFLSVLEAEVTEMVHMAIKVVTNFKNPRCEHSLQLLEEITARFQTEREKAGLFPSND